MSDKMREEFEAWIKSRSGNIAKRDGDYLSSMTRYEWLIWQASRQALVVQLPLWRHNQGEQVYSINEVKQALADAGVDFKS